MLRFVLVAALAVYFSYSFYQMWSITALPFIHAEDASSKDNLFRSLLRQGEEVKLHFTLIQILESSKKQQRSIYCGNLTVLYDRNHAEIVRGSNISSKEVESSWWKFSSTVQEKVLNIAIPERFIRNATLYLRVEMESGRRKLTKQSGITDIVLTSMTKPDWKKANKRLLLQDVSGAKLQAIQKDLRKNGFTDYDVLGIPSRIEVGLVVETSGLNTSTLQPQFSGLVDHHGKTYSFPPYVNKFISPRDEYIPLLSAAKHLPSTTDSSTKNSSTDHVLSIVYRPMSSRHWMFYEIVGESLETLEKKAGFGSYDIDSIKMMMTGTAPWLLGLTFAVSALHLIFELLALSHDIEFWRRQKSFQGLSANTLVLELLSSSIILLYLRCEGESVIIQIFLTARCAMDIWKISKIMTMSTSTSFPFLHIKRTVTIPNQQDKKDQDKLQKDCEEFESSCMRILGFAILVPVLAVCVYQLVFVKQKSWYSWFVTSLAMSAYAGGFVTMTPQVFRNYRMKSVDHLPWTVLTYQAINTFIDDLFTLLIRMPQMHKMSVFRDDIVWLVYTFQRFKYSKPPSPKNKIGATQQQLDTSINGKKAN